MARIEGQTKQMTTPEEQFERGMQRSLEMIVQCCQCKLVKVDDDHWISPVVYPGYILYEMQGKISHGYCKPCAIAYLGKFGIPTDGIV